MARPAYRQDSPTSERKTPVYKALEECATPIGAIAVEIDLTPDQWGWIAQQYQRAATEAIAQGRAYPNALKIHQSWTTTGRTHTYITVTSHNGVAEYHVGRDGRAVKLA